MSTTNRTSVHKFQSFTTITQPFQRKKTYRNTHIEIEAMASVGKEVSNKQLILRDYVTGSPKESDMYVKTSTIKLEIPNGSKAVLLKNLYLSCNPVMRIRMNRAEDSIFTSYTPSSVSLYLRVHIYSNTQQFL